MSDKPAPVAFVIMPFGGEFDDVFIDIIRPALVDYDVIRGDSRLDERNILEKIVTGIDDAALIVADVTGMNGNVMYELGIAHALRKPTIMIAQSVTDLSFDIRSYPVHEYGVAQARADKLSSLLRELAAGYRQGLIVFGNPVADFINSAVLSTTPTESPSGYTAEMCVDDVTWAAEQTGAFFQRFHEISERNTDRIGRAAKKIGSAGTPVRENPGVREAADATRDFAQELEELTADFHEIWIRFGRGMRWVLAPEQRPYVGDDVVRRYVAGARQSSRSFDDILGNLAELREVQQKFPRYSGNLGHALDVSSSAISNLLNEIMTAKSYLAWIIKRDPGSA